MPGDSNKERLAPNERAIKQTVDIMPGAPQRHSGKQA